MVGSRLWIRRQIQLSWGRRQLGKRDKTQLGQRRMGKIPHQRSWSHYDCAASLFHNVGGRHRVRLAEHGRLYPNNLPAVARLALDRSRQAWRSVLKRNRSDVNEGSVAGSHVLWFLEFFEREFAESRFQFVFEVKQPRRCVPSQRRERLE